MPLLPRPVFTTPPPAKLSNVPIHTPAARACPPNDCFVGLLSSYGWVPIPHVHGLTIGELALLFNAYAGIRQHIGDPSTCTCWENTDILHVHEPNFCVKTAPMGQVPQQDLPRSWTHRRRPACRRRRRCIGRGWLSGRAGGKVRRVGPTRRVGGHRARLGER